MRSTGLTLAQHIGTALIDYQADGQSSLGAYVLNALRARVPAEYVGTGRFTGRSVTHDTLFKGPADYSGADRRAAASSPAYVQMSVFFSEEGCEEAAVARKRAGRELERKRKGNVAEGRNSYSSAAGMVEGWNGEGRMEVEAAAASMQILAAAAAALSDGESRNQGRGSGRRAALGAGQCRQPGDGDPRVATDTSEESCGKCLELRRV